MARYRDENKKQKKLQGLLQFKTELNKRFTITLPNFKRRGGLEELWANLLLTQGGEYPRL